MQQHLFLFSVAGEHSCGIFCQKDCSLLSKNGAGETPAPRLSYCVPKNCHSETSAHTGCGNPFFLGSPFTGYWGISSIVKASIMSPLPMKRGFMGAPDQSLFGRSEFRQSKVLRCKTLVRKTCGTAALRRKATGAFPVSAVFPYWGISSIVKASIMSPSLISLNFSMVMPHS